jgi:uncharacterized protein YidB (DUF937 family)
MAIMEQAAAAAGSRAGGGVDAAGLARTAVDLLGAARGGAFAGLSGLRAAFEQAGLGAAFASWVGMGPNRPITAAELVSALGPQAIDRLAKSVGAAPARVAAGLAEVLPRVIDQLTPAGVLPDDGGEPLAAANRPCRRP